MSAPAGWSPTFKWFGVGGDFMEREARFLIRRVREPGARGKLVERWTLHVRLLVPEGEEDAAPWRWSECPVHRGKTKRDCQHIAETHEFAIHANPARAGTPAGRHARTGEMEGDEEETTHSCVWCGVRFKRPERWRFGDLCGSGCAATMREILDEVGA